MKLTVAASSGACLEELCANNNHDNNSKHQKEWQPRLQETTDTEHDKPTNTEIARRTVEINTHLTASFQDNLGKPVPERKNHS